MSTISNERLEELANGDMEVWYSESQSMARELLALRKERQKTEPIVYMNRFTGRAFELEQQPGADKDHDVYIPLYAAPPAPVVPEGWKLVPIELTKEMRGKIHPFAESLCHGCGREVVADCEDNVTASWNDMLAVAPAPVGKQSSTAEGNNDGFECTPVADLYELLTKCGECYDYTTSSKVAADWIKEGYSAREYVKLDRLQEAMTHGSSGEPDGWIPCSERMPEIGEEVLMRISCNDHFNIESGKYKGDGLWLGCWFSTYGKKGSPYQVTHWMPIPAAPEPCK